MTIDEAIKHCLEVANSKEIEAEFETDNVCYFMTDKEREECKECAADHRQLAEWLTELKDLREENKVLTSECDRLIKEKGELLKQHEQIAEYKRLLKAAVEDINWINEHTQDDDGSCIMRSGCSGCPLDINGDLFCKWKHADEALALIKEDGETNG